MTKYNYSKLRGLIREKFGTEGAFAKAMDRSPAYISNVMNGSSFFTMRDIENAVRLLGITSDDIVLYFFTKEVHDAELTD